MEGGGAMKNHEQGVQIQPLLNTIPEAHTRLRISQAKLFMLIKAGEISVVKIGRRTLVPESELQRIAQVKLVA
jgi:excisionase family DNA binding protein